jgi:hypothetical protein
MKSSLVIAAWVAASAIALARPADAPQVYDPAAEVTVKGVLVQVVGAEGRGGVGLHLMLDTGAGTVNVHVAPAEFVGQQNFWFGCEDKVEVVGAYVMHAGERGLWARTVAKDGHTLVVRKADGTPAWPSQSDPDPDGCGIAHPPVR